MIFPNATNPLNIPTHEGSNQVVHPSIIDFQLEHGIESWGGYRYWMVMTPYPNSNDAHEDPNIVASNDGITWVVPNGLVNPIDNAQGTPMDYNSDPNMIYDPTTNKLWVYYRYYLINNKMELRLIKLSNDMSYTTPQIIKTENPFIPDHHSFRSLFIWRESTTKWHMWGGGGTRPYKTYYHFSTDGVNWGTPTQTVDINGNDPFSAINYESWHLTGKPNLKEGKIEFFSYCRSLGGSDDANAKIIHAQSEITNLTVITIPNNLPVLNIGSGWDNGHLYSCSFVIEELAKGYKYHLWYSAKSSSGIWGVGYTFAEDINGLSSWKESLVEYVKYDGKIKKITKKWVKTNIKWSEIDIYVKH